MLNFKKKIKKNLKNEIYSLIDNRIQQLIASYKEYVDYSQTNEFENHKRLYEFGFLCSDNVKKYRNYINFMKRYSWLIDKQEYYKKKYPDFIFIDEYLDDQYFFEKYKDGSTSKVRMIGTIFNGNITINDFNIIEKNLLSIENKDRLIYHHFHTNCGETLCFGNLKIKEQKLVLDTNNDDWFFKGVEIISHSSFLFDNKPDLAEYFGVVLCPVDKGFLQD